MLRLQDTTDQRGLLGRMANPPSVSLINQSDGGSHLRLRRPTQSFSLSHSCSSLRIFTQSIMTALRESVAIVSHTSDNTNRKKDQPRTFLPSNSPSSAYSSREKRRHANSCAECQQDQLQVRSFAIFHRERLLS